MKDTWNVAGVFICNRFGKGAEHLERAALEVLEISQGNQELVKATCKHSVAVEDLR